MSNLFKYFISVFFCFACAVPLAAQPTSESQRGAYSVEQVRQARETAEMNRHYESMKPVNSSASNTNNSGSYSPYQPYKYSEKARQQYLENQRLERLAALQKQKAEQQQVFNNRKERFSMELVNKGIVKIKENYTSIISMAVSNSLPDTFYYRVFGRNEQEFEQKIISNDYTLNLYFPNASKMMRPTGSSYYTNYIAPQNAVASKTVVPDYKKDSLKDKTTILDGLRLKDKPVNTAPDKKDVYNKLLIKPRTDTLQQNSNSIYKSLQLGN